MKLYSYIVKHDYGSAPNPFWGKLTLAVCKPEIRRTAEIGDWIIGTGSKNINRPDKSFVNYSYRLVYAMKVTERMTFKE